MVEHRLDIDTLRGLPEGSVVITHQVAWAKIGPDEWRCPFREHIPDRSISPRWNGQFRWHDEKNSAWLAEVATEVVYNPDAPTTPHADDRGAYLRGYEFALTHINDEPVQADLARLHADDRNEAGNE